MMINPKTAVAIAKGAKYVVVSVVVPIASAAISCGITESLGAAKDMFNTAVANGYDMEFGKLKLHRSATII